MYCCYKYNRFFNHQRVTTPLSCYVHLKAVQFIPSTFSHYLYTIIRLKIKHPPDTPYLAETLVGFRKSSISLSHIATFSQSNGSKFHEVKFNLNFLLRYKGIGTGPQMVVLVPLNCLSPLNIKILTPSSEIR